MNAYVLEQMAVLASKVRQVVMEFLSASDALGKSTAIIDAAAGRAKTFEERSSVARVRVKNDRLIAEFPSVESKVRSLVDVYQSIRKNIGMEPDHLGFAITTAAAVVAIVGALATAVTVYFLTSAFNRRVAANLKLANMLASGELTNDQLDTVVNTGVTGSDPVGLKSVVSLASVALAGFLGWKLWQELN